MIEDAHPEPTVPEPVHGCSMTTVVLGAPSRPSPARRAGQDEPGRAEPRARWIPPHPAGRLLHGARGARVSLRSPGWPSPEPVEVAEPVGGGGWTTWPEPSCRKSFFHPGRAVEVNGDHPAGAGGACQFFDKRPEPRAGAPCSVVYEHEQA